MPAPVAVFWSCLDMPAQAPSPSSNAAATVPIANLCIVFIELPLRLRFASGTSFVRDADGSELSEGPAPHHFDLDAPIGRQACDYCGAFLCARP
jgi:hypothetical protein